MLSRQGYHNRQPHNYSFQSRNLTQSPMKRSYLNQQSYLKRHKEDAQIIFEYELKRQRQKVIVLEERLKNKEIFISQMKQFQKELSKAFDQSQQELKYYRLKCQQLQDVNINDYQVEIQELKQLLQKSEIQKRQLQRELKKLFKDQIRQKQSSKRELKKSKATIQFGERTDRLQKTRSNTLTFWESFYKSFQNYSKQQILQSGNKLGTFNNCFMQMVKNCNPKVAQMTLKDQLRYSWKWIKNIVKSYMRQQKGMQLTNSNQYSNQIQKLFNFRSTKQIVPIIQDSLKENKEYKKVIDLVVDYYKIDKKADLKDIYEFIRKKKEKKNIKQ